LKKKKRNKQLYRFNIIDFSQNASKYWVSANLDNKRRIQKLVFPAGLVIDTAKRQYLTSNVNVLFVAKRSFSRHPEAENKKLPTEISEESGLAGTGAAKGRPGLNLCPPCTCAEPCASAKARATRGRRKRKADMSPGYYRKSGRISFRMNSLPLYEN